MKPDSSAKSDSEDLLAPPEFGSFDGGSSDTMLPIATSMEELLDADDVSGPSAAALAAERFAESEAGDEGAPKVEAEVDEEVDEAPKASNQKKAAAAANVAAAKDEPEVVAAVAAEDSLEPAPNRTPLIIGAAAVILLGIGVAVMSGGSDDAGASSSSEAGAAAQASGSEQPEAQPTPSGDPSSGAPTKPSPTPSPSKGDGGEGSLPSDLEALKAMPFAERHKLLAVANNDVVVEDHVALDLVQAKDAPEPCRTFSDALSTIESADDTEPFSWAIEEAVVPNTEDPACTGLSARLARLKEEEAAAEPTRRSSRRSSKRRNSRSSSRSPAPNPAPQKPEPPEPEPVPAEPVKPDPEPKTKPAPQPSVASKLDDEGLKNLD